MKKSDIAGRVADRIGLSQSAAGYAVDAVFEAVGEALANGEEVRIAGFGTFGARNRPARTGRNPQTGESLSISGGHDVRAARPRSAPLVRAGGISGAGGFVRCPVAQDRPLRPLPVVRRSVRGRPHEGALVSF